jgi:hypothetical protein
MFTPKSKTINAKPTSIIDEAQQYVKQSGRSAISLLVDVIIHKRTPVFRADTVRFVDFDKRSTIVEFGPYDLS